MKKGLRRPKKQRMVSKNTCYRPGQPDPRGDHVWARKDTDTAGCSLLPPVGSWVLQEALQPMIVPYHG